MSMTVSVRIAHKSASKAATQRRHNERIGAQPKYVDATRTHLNSVLINAPTEVYLRDKCEALRSKRATKRKMKVDAAVLTDGIITFGTEAQKVIESLSTEEQDALFLETAKRIASYSKTELVSLTVHRDETAVHAHFGMLAFNRDGMPLSKSLKPRDTEKLQNIAGDVFKNLGINRGVKKVVRKLRGDDKSKIIHRSVKQLHDDLPLELEAKQREINALRARIEAQEAKAKEYEQHIAMLRSELQKLQRIKLHYGHQEADNKVQIGLVVASTKNDGTILSETELHKAGAYFTSYELKADHAIIKNPYTEMHDYGNRLSFSKNADLKASAYLAVAVASAKGWNNVEVSGSSEFIAHVQQALHDSNLAIKVTTKNNSPALH
jgi:hypothetical protein